MPPKIAAIVALSHNLLTKVGTAKCSRAAWTMFYSMVCFRPAFLPASAELVIRSRHGLHSFASFVGRPAITMHVLGCICGHFAHGVNVASVTMVTYVVGVQYTRGFVLTCVSHSDRPCPVDGGVKTVWVVEARHQNSWWYSACECSATSRAMTAIVKLQQAGVALIEYDGHHRDRRSMVEFGNRAALSRRVFKNINNNSSEGGEDFGIPPRSKIAGRLCRGVAAASGLGRRCREVGGIIRPEVGSQFGLYELMCHVRDVA